MARFFGIAAFLEKAEALFSPYDVFLLAFSEEIPYNNQAVFMMTIGSRAILRCEPCQVLTEAAVSALMDVLRVSPV